MKKIILIVAVFALVANVSAQLKVDANGDTRISKNIYLEGTSGILGTTSNVPIRFRVNDVLAGSTGSSNKSNVSFGYGALNSNTTGGNNNTAIGGWALNFNTSGVYNTANGTYALYRNTTGSTNTAIGHSALYSNTVGEVNIAIGGRALYSNLTGILNTAIGYSALYYSATGRYNTAIGYLALYYSTLGHGNTANGYYALYSNTTGSDNTAIGLLADVNADNLNNTTTIGRSALATSSNQVRIGNSSVTSIGGYASWTNLSDKRAKKNIRADVPGLDFINRLQPVTYNLDLDAIDDLLKIDKTKREGEEELPQELKDINKKAREAKEKQLQTGFIAQDVEAIAKSIGYDFSGVDVDEAGIYGLRYAEFVVPLVKAVQELSEQNNRLQAQVNELAELVYTLQGKDAAPSASTPKSQLPTEAEWEYAASNGASLQQNVPNPFSQTTVIRYSLPQTCSSAQLVVSNTAGAIVRQIPLSCSGGAGSITIESGALPAGSYYYSLYVDGRLSDTKQMILTK